MAETVIAFVGFTSGSYEGAIVFHMRLANELRRRGFRVLVYWMMNSNGLLVDKGIVQRVLCSGIRYHFNKPSSLTDRLSRVINLMPAHTRRNFMQKRPLYVQRLMANFCRTVCDGDPGLSRRLARFITRDGVTHLIPTFAMVCPIAEGAKAAGASFDYLVIFQGEEIFANFAQQVGRLDDYHRRLRQTMAGSPWPSVAVSADYRTRLVAEMGLDEARMCVIPPGIDAPGDGGTEAGPADFALLKSRLPGLRDEVPIVSYIGRQDPEKGLDLLLYAAKLLQERGVRFQLVLAGGSSFGRRYRESCRTIAEHLRLAVHWRGRIDNDSRAAIYRRSHCVVYPSIHREPFGMVAAEAMSFGTPVLVPDIGGIREMIESNGRRGGLAFKTWDSGDLANQLERLLSDQALHGELAANARDLAANYTIERAADRTLAHMGLPPRAP